MSKIMTGRAVSRVSIAAAAITTAGAGLSGMASAMTYNQNDWHSSGYQGNQYHMNYGGYGGSGDYRLSDWRNTNLSWADDWDNWNPSTWQHEGRNFDSWYNGCMNWLSSHSGSSYWHYGGQGGSDEHGGYGDNDWDSWNPRNFEGHGSYEAWYHNMMQYMHDNYGHWQQQWGDNHGANYGGRGGDDHDHVMFSDYHNNYDDRDNDQDDHGGYGGDSDNDHSYNHDHNDNYGNDDHMHYGGQGGDTHYSDNHHDNGGGYGNDHDHNQSYGDTNDHGGYGGSNDHASSLTSQTTNVTNNNDVTVDNTTTQTATSGDVTVRGADNVRSATSGDATNNSSTHTNVAVDNATTTPSGGSGADSNYGTDWDSMHRNSLNLQSTTVRNTNDVTVTNDTTQTATSGDVTVRGNDHVGNVSSGDATNTSNTNTRVSVADQTNAN